MSKTDILLSKTLYNRVKEFHEDEASKSDDKVVPESVQHKDLLPTLRSYQARAVRWMLDMEKEERTIKIHHDGDTEVHLGKGGILADEMGLGKTVEVLACILANPNNESAGEMEAYIEELRAKLDVDRTASTSLTEPEIVKFDVTDIKEEKPIITDTLSGSISFVMKRERNDKEDDRMSIEGVNTPLKAGGKPLVDLNVNDNFVNKPDMNLNVNSRRKRNRKEVFYCEDMYDDLTFDEAKIVPCKQRKVNSCKITNGGNDIVYSESTVIEDNGRTHIYVPNSTNTLYDDTDSKKKEEIFMNDMTPKNESNSVFRCKKRKRSKRKNDQDDNPSCTPTDATKETIDSDDGMPSKRKRGRKTTVTDVETPEKPNRRGLLKRQLSKWYDELLFEMTPTYRRNKLEKLALLKMESQFRCCCADNVNTTDSDHVECPICKKLQHSVCAGVKSEGYNSDDPYICFQCWPKQKAVPSCGTLIVSPSSISNQWLEEIKKHTRPGLKVLVYNGVRHNGYIQPTTLSRYDIVITNYQVLIKELDYVSLESNSSSRSMRYAKKFFAPSSPLTCIKWWRLCLDEAQLVESVTNKMAEMVSELNAINRWAVCGTPIQKSIHDLYGLVSFLRITPYCQKNVWSRLFKNHDALLEFFPFILWRTGKVDVLDELGVPPQTIVPHWLNFSPVESHFYQKQHMDCSKLFMEKIAGLPSLDVPLDKIDRRLVNKTMAPLLRLRQACVHPQLIRGQFIALKKTMTMEELLNQMVSKAVVESEEALRVVISSLNGIAAIYIIMGDLVDAIDNYRQVLHFVQDYDGRLKIDSLQKIHTMHNLAEMLESHHPSIAPTLHDDSLREDARSIEKVYLEKRKGDMGNTKGALLSLGKSIARVSENVELSEFDWWISLLHWLPDWNDWVNKMELDLENNKKLGMSLLAKVHSPYALLDEIYQWLQNIEDYRSKVTTKLNQLEELPLDSLASDAQNCHLKMKNSNKQKPSKRCLICNCELALKHYEALLFSIKNKQSDMNMSHLDQTMVEDDSPVEEDIAEDLNAPGGSQDEHRDIANLKAVGTVFETYNAGTWKPSQHEHCLRMLLAWGNKKQCDRQWVSEGNTHLEVLNMFRKEFKYLRLLWTQLSDYISARDELHMAKMRLRLPYEDELNDMSKKLKNHKKENYIIESHEVNATLMRMHAEKAVAESDLKKKTGILLYLQNLQKNGDKQHDPCPICRNQLNDRWSVLRCGHCFCFNCIPVLLSNCGGTYLVCPVCRERTASCDVSYIEGNSPDELNDSVRGSHTTKVHAVIASLIRLRNEDPNVKVLIFSMWDRVLDVLGEALTMNNINFRRLTSIAKKRNAALSQFKAMEGITALLLPINHGAKGLNLVEATHVFLIEPLLNPADELQAIGRIHRIGQTKQTYVHRFVVKATIEEKMLSAIEIGGTEKWAKEKITISQLADLFSPIEK